MDIDNIQLSMPTSFAFPLESSPAPNIQPTWQEPNVSRNEILNSIVNPIVTPVTTKVGISLFSIVKREAIGIVTGGFIAYLGLQSMNPVFAYSGIALAVLYVLRNYFD